jgi:hypothetical protein
MLKLKESTHFQHLLLQLRTNQMPGVIFGHFYIIKSHNRTFGSLIQIFLLVF